MKLISVYEADPELTATTLWDLLTSRPAVANISHKSMPTWQEHLAFIASKPYPIWYLIEGPVELSEVGYISGFIGSIYLTKNNEIGLGILESYRGRGYGSAALGMFMRLHPRDRYLAHVAPANLQGQSFWLKHGFKPLQVTYDLRAS